MLETFYQTFGFFGAFLMAFLCFIFFIFWIAGIAGISEMPQEENKTMKMIFSVLFPPYPFIWMLYDINRERKLMQDKE